MTSNKFILLSHSFEESHDVRVIADAFMTLGRELAFLFCNKEFNNILHSSKNSFEIINFNLIIALVTENDKDIGSYLRSVMTKIKHTSFLNNNSDVNFGCEEIISKHTNLIDELNVAHYTNSFFVSVPTTDLYVKYKISYILRIMNDELFITDVEKQIINISASGAASKFVESNKSSIISDLSIENFFENTSKIFPYVRFGSDTAHQIEYFNQSTIQPIIKTISALNNTMLEWRSNKRSFPNWQCSVSGESKSVNNNKDLRSKRVFKSYDGQSYYYETHAKVGNSNRIHFRVLEDTKLIEIGYFGKHLPTVTNQT